MVWLRASDGGLWNTDWMRIIQAEGPNVRVYWKDQDLRDILVTCSSEEEAKKVIAKFAESVDVRDPVTRAKG